jgi:hypothetical protein
LARNKTHGLPRIEIFRRNPLRVLGFYAIIYLEPATAEAPYSQRNLFILGSPKFDKKTFLKMTPAGSGR